MKLWSETTSQNDAVDAFTVGNDRAMDERLARWDVVGSIAHVSMLAKVGLLEAHESELLIQELQNLLERIDIQGFTIDDDVEDVHSQVELYLTQKLGDVGKRIHTGRSRNDQVLVDMKLFMRHELRTIVQQVLDVANTMLSPAKTYQHLLLPGYTHYQVAMPSSFGLWFGGYAEALLEDVRILEMAVDAADANPLGSAAGYGSSFPLDRDVTTEALNFSRLHVTSTFAQMSRGRTERIAAFAIASVSATLSKFAGDAVHYMSTNFRFIGLSQAFTTGSSIMPHKKNPDVFEVLRARCNRLQSLPYEVSLMTTNLPSGYHRDMQFIKDRVIPAIDEIKECLSICSIVVPAIEPNATIFDDGMYDPSFSVEAINALVQQGVPFRTAYQQVAEQLRSGEYMANKNIVHTHIGSIGNPGLEILEARLQEARAHRR